MLDVLICMFPKWEVGVMAACANISQICLRALFSKVGNSLSENKAFFNIQCSQREVYLYFADNMTIKYIG